MIAIRNLSEKCYVPRSYRGMDGELNSSKDTLRVLMIAVVPGRLGFSHPHVLGSIENGRAVNPLVFGDAAYKPQMPVGTQANAAPAQIAAKSGGGGGDSNSGFGVDIDY